VGADRVAQRLAQLARELTGGAAANLVCGCRLGPRVAPLAQLPPCQESAQPGRSLRASAKIVSGAGIELKAR